MRVQIGPTNADQHFSQHTLLTNPINSFVGIRSWVDSKKTESERVGKKGGSPLCISYPIRPFRPHVRVVVYDLRQHLSDSHGQLAVDLCFRATLTLYSRKSGPGLQETSCTSRMPPPEHGVLGGTGQRCTTDVRSTTGTRQAASEHFIIFVVFHQL